MDKALSKVVEGLKEVTAKLDKKYPEAGFSFGYIGSCYLGAYNTRVDGRMWFIFTKLQNENGSSVSFGGWCTQNLPCFLLSVQANIDWWVQEAVIPLISQEVPK